MNIITVVALGLITFHGAVVVATNQARPVVTTETAQPTNDPLLTYALSNGPVQVELRTYQ